MPHILLKGGAAAVALALIGFAGQADATMRPLLKETPSLIVQVEDTENEEVQNLFEPESDDGVPGGPAAMGEEPPPAAEEGNVEEGSDAESEAIEQEQE